MLTVVGAAHAADDVIVVGDRNPDNPHEFIWTVTNNTHRPITTFAATHFLGKIVTPPPGWEEVELTANIAKGQAAVPGILRCRATSGLTGIRRGQTTEFRLRVDRRGAHYAGGRVTLGFDDGTTRVVEGVLCPAQEPYLNRNFPVIGLGGMFIVFLAVRSLRRRRGRSGAQPSDDVAAESG